MTDVTTRSILGTGSYLPERHVSNDEIGGPAGVDHDWIVGKTAIAGRRFAADHEASSDLATEACRRALDDAGLQPDDVDYLILATSTPDHLQPPTACFVQHNLQAHKAAAFDTNAVCSGFVYALSTADRMLRGGEIALVVGVDTYSRILNRKDRRTTILFGDGAGAAVVGREGQGTAAHRVTATSLHSFGALTDKIIVPAGGSRMPLRPEHWESGEAYFTTQGRDVKEFVLNDLPPLVAKFLAEQGLQPSDIDHFVPHQANGMMLDDLVVNLGFEHAKVHRTLEDYGNTGSASVGITLDAAARAGEINAGDRVLLAGFGGGMAAGLALVTW